MDGSGQLKLLLVGLMDDFFQHRDTEVKELHRDKIQYDSKE